MNTSIQYFDVNTLRISSCGDILDIHESSKSLNWDGILLERGTSPYFHPKNVQTSTFYFALELSQKYGIDVKKNDGSFVSYMQPDDIWFNPPFTPFTHNIDKFCDFIIVTITPEKMIQGFGAPFPKDLLFLNNYSLKDPVLLKLIQLLYLEVNAPSKNGTWYVDHIIGLISNHVIHNYSNYDTLQAENYFYSFNEEKLKKLTVYIQEHISELIQIEQLANIVNMSKFYFLKEFKQFTAITPYQYILRQKINHSKKLLIDTTDPITSIALDLGFNDASHFSKTFKQHEGISPKKFRQGHQ